MAPLAIELVTMHLSPLARLVCVVKHSLEG